MNEVNKAGINMYKVLLVTFSFLHISIQGNSSGTYGFLENIGRSVIAPVTVGIACGISGKKLGENNAIDAVAVFIGTGATLCSLIMAPSYKDSLSHASFLAAYLVTRSFNGSKHRS